MKTTIAILSLVLVPSVASAQSPDPSKWMCRNLADSGGFTYQGESIFGTQACRPIQQAPPAASIAPAAVATPQQEATMATVSGSVAAPVVPVTQQPAPLATPTAAANPATISDGKTRVFVTDSQSWETRGGSSAGGNKNGWGGSSWMAGGARPQTAEIIKTLNERCPEMLSITHKFGPHDETKFNVCESGQTSPDDAIPGRSIARTGQIAAQSGEFG